MNPKANGVECYDCGLTRKTIFEECDRDIDHVVMPVFIEDCPSGVTVADWHAGTTSACDSENHEWKSGLHITPVED